MSSDNFQTWLENFKKTPEFATLQDHPIAYFCAEYALPKIDTYAGGLGILAADYVQEATDQEIPLVAVGLMYGDHHPDLQLVCDKENKPITLKIPIQDHEVLVQAYMYTLRKTRFFLLDTHVDTNTPQDQRISDKLYVADKETRLKQELILGIGGLRLLNTLGIAPAVYHLNEGHSGFLFFELIHKHMAEKGESFEEAKKLVGEKVIFTNHTLLSAGDEIYSDDLMSLIFAEYAKALGIPVSDLVKLGLVQESSTFSLTMLCLRHATASNAVSALHAKKAKDIWLDHPMQYVTNGIYQPSWDQLTTDISGHAANKQKLLDLIKAQSGASWQANTLLLGWARRFVEYKRPLAILENLDRFLSIARNTNRPVKVVFAGTPHESDVEGQKMLETLLTLIKEKIGDVVVYLPGYNIELAHTLVAGCDVWLNTPIVGFEACGTSGMKAALNGVLPCSTPDGWVDEVEMYKVGWTLDNDHLSENILDVLEKDIAPMYYDQKAEWETLMRNARQMVQNQFSTARMLRQYVDQLYFPSNTAI